MTFHTIVQQDSPPEVLISEALTLYATAAGVFSLVIDEAAKGKLKNPKDAAAYAREYNLALQTFLSERAKVEKLRKDTEGIVHDYALDFDAARDEIGRRLACLRDAADG